jgi:hypothetical protein
MLYKLTRLYEPELKIQFTVISRVLEITHVSVAYCDQELNSG